MSVSVDSAKPGRRWLRVLAWVAVVVSFPVWGAAVLVVPFLPISAGSKVGLAAVCIGVAEGLFWMGGLVLGAGVLQRFWRRRKP
jgi:hypothetical protein